MPPAFACRPRALPLPWPGAALGPVLLLVLVLTVSAAESMLAAAGAGGESCQTLSTEMVITKEKTADEAGVVLGYSAGPARARPLRLLCVGTVRVNKCEGTCASQVSPSVVQFPGFLKECRCCRERRLVERLVTLTTCYDGASRVVPGAAVSLYISEPDQCQCYDCAV